MQLHHTRDRLRAAGAELVVVGNGAPHYIAGFREVTGYDGPLYTDPSLASFAAAELERGFFKVVNPAVLGNAVRALRTGARQGRVQGDGTQQGGVLVILPGGELVYRHASRVAGDNAPADEVAAALEAAVGGGPAEAGSAES